MDIIKAFFRELSSPPPNGTYWANDPEYSDEIFVAGVYNGLQYYMTEPGEDDNPPGPDPTILFFNEVPLLWGPKVQFNPLRVEYPVCHPLYQEGQSHGDQTPHV